MGDSQLPPSGPPRSSASLPPPRRSRDHVLRHAWGAYYAIWALAVLALLLVGLVTLTYPPSAGLSFGRVLAYLVVAVGAGLYTIRYFREVWQQTHFPLWRVGRAFLAAFLLLAGGLTVVALVPSLLGLTLLGVVLVVDAALLAYQLRWSLGYVPGDGWIAVGSLLASAVGSIAAAVTTQNLLLYGSFWMIMVVAWGLCAISAYVRGDPAPPMGVPQRSG